MRGCYGTMHVVTSAHHRLRCNPRTAQRFSARSARLLSSVRTLLRTGLARLLVLARGQFPAALQGRITLLRLLHLPLLLL
jgi:hypothetical protein